MDLELSEKILLLECYIIGGKSITNAIRAFCTKKRIKNDRHKPPIKSVKYLIKKFYETGSLAKQKPPGRSSNDFFIEVVQSHVEEFEGNVSVRSTAAAVTPCKSTVHNILRNSLCLTPYKTTLDSKLTDNSIEERLEFVNTFLSHVADDENFLNRVLFSDESNFDTNPRINKQNDRIWRSEKPAACGVKEQYPKKVCVWLGITTSFIIGPYFFDGTVNQTTYQDMLQKLVIPELKRRRKYSNVIFQQDGATCHTSREVKDFLRHHFGENRVISRGFPFKWPGYSHDLTPLDFSVWPVIKAKVNARNFSSINDLRDAIEAEIAAISQDYFRACILAVPERCRKCLEKEGQRFESDL